MKEYNGFVPPCGIFCGACPNYTKENHPCQGANVHCRNRQCKGIYVCCKLKKGKNFCYECNSFPCSRFKAFATCWVKLGQDLILNQKELQKLGECDWLTKWNRSSEI